MSVGKHPSEPMFAARVGVAASALLLAGCNLDLFCDCKALPGGYSLERWEDGVTFYLDAPGERKDGGGAIDGTVLEMGWNDTLIAAKRHAMFRGDGDGWMVIDIASGSIRGPITDAEFADIARRAKLTVLPARQAWERL